MKKYKFTGETKDFLGIKLRRIQAEKDFGDIKAGELGGWIEKEENLRQYGYAWVYGDAQVSGYARVYRGEWDKSPLYIQGTRWSINISSPDTVQCGCQNHTFQEWHDKYAEISMKYGAEDILDEYIMYFNLICDRYGHEDCKIVR